MGEPFGTGALVAGAGLSAYGAYKQGVAADRAARFNAEMMRREAGAVLRQGAQDARTIEIDGRRMAASVQAANAAGSVAGGSVDTQQLSLAAAVARDADMARANAARAAWAKKIEAGQTRVAGKQARTAGAIMAGGHIVSGAGMAADRAGRKGGG